jgi:antitoxin VapB
MKVKYILGYGTVEKAKLFKNGQSQAVRLPREFRFEGTEVYLQRMGKGVLLLPVKDFWDTWIADLNDFSADFMLEGREQPLLEDEREQL